MSLSKKLQNDIESTSASKLLVICVDRDDDIGKLANEKELPNDEGTATFTIKTGINAGSKSGTVYIDIVGLNSGARETFQLTVSASGT